MLIRDIYSIVFCHERLSRVSSYKRSIWEVSMLAFSGRMQKYPTALEINLNIFVILATNSNSLNVHGVSSAE